jgi:hypothetical protein
MSKGIAAIIVAGLVLASGVRAEELLPTASLFLTPQELYEAEMLARKLPPAPEGDIHLGAVLYYSPDDWTLWLQGEKWTPETVRGDLRVLEVTEDGVRLMWRDDKRQEHEITLKPNQSYQIATGKVIAER